jgi:hypothetical protein
MKTLKNCLVLGLFLTILIGLINCKNSQLYNPIEPPDNSNNKPTVYEITKEYTGSPVTITTPYLELTLTKAWTATELPDQWFPTYLWKPKNGIFLITEIKLKNINYQLMLTWGVLGGDTSWTIIDNSGNIYTCDKTVSSHTLPNFNGAHWTKPGEEVSDAFLFDVPTANLTLRFYDECIGMQKVIHDIRFKISL